MRLMNNITIMVLFQNSPVITSISQKENLMKQVIKTFSMRFLNM